MKLSDIRGEKALDIVADIMELVDAMADDDRVKSMVQELRVQGGDPSRIICRHLPSILKDSGYKERIISVLAVASGVSYEDYASGGPLIMDLLELLTSDAETLGFLIGTSSQTD